MICFREVTDFLDLIINFCESCLEIEKNIYLPFLLTVGSLVLYYSVYLTCLNNILNSWPFFTKLSFVFLRYLKMCIFWLLVTRCIKLHGNHIFVLGITCLRLKVHNLASATWVSCPACPPASLPSNLLIASHPITLAFLLVFKHTLLIYHSASAHGLPSWGRSSLNNLSR